MIGNDWHILHSKPAQAIQGLEWSWMIRNDSHPETEWCRAQLPTAHRPYGPKSASAAWNNRRNASRQRRRPGGSHGRDYDLGMSKLWSKMGDMFLKKSKIIQDPNPPPARSIMIHPDPRYVWEPLPDRANEELWSKNSNRLRRQGADAPVDSCESILIKPLAWQRSSSRGFVSSRCSETDWSDWWFVALSSKCFQEEWEQVELQAKALQDLADADTLKAKDSWPTSRHCLLFGCFGWICTWENNFIVSSLD